MGPRAPASLASRRGVHWSLGFLFLGDPRVSQPDQAFALHARCAIAELDVLQAPVTAGKLDAMDASVACLDKEPFQKALQEVLASGGVKMLKGELRAGRELLPRLLRPAAGDVPRR